MDWKQAFYRQALSDFEHYKDLSANKNSVPLCYQLQVFLFAMEKLAKAWISQAGSPPPAKHPCIATFLIQTVSIPRFREEMNFQKYNSYKSYIDSIMPVAGKLDQLHPTSEGLLNTEYPWEDNGSIIVPSTYHFNEIVDASNNTPWVKFVGFAHNAFRVSGLMDDFREEA